MKRTRQRLLNALEATADEVIRIRKIGNNYKTFSVAVEDSPPFDAAKETIFVDGLAWKLLYLFSGNQH